MSDLIIGTSAFANVKSKLLKEAGIGYIRADLLVPYPPITLSKKASTAYLRLSRV